MSLDDFLPAGNSAPVSLAPRSLSSPIDGVSLWFVALTVSGEEFARIADWLSPAEHSRAARFGREYLRRRYIIGRAALRWALGRTLSLAPPAVPIVRGERGRPRLDGIDGIDFNVSHTADVALIGIARGGARIGVDIERADRGVNADGLARKFLTPAERATLASLSADERRARFVRYWTCKEALSKATGDGLSAPFREMEITLGENIALARGPKPYDPSRWRLHGTDVPDGYVATLALTSGSGLP
ncbi:MAG TPA: 4'-phosphopantetheinyl transferase superfamily protein [Casimicrobiaceae bacterium]|nr:4'-phosphopantetheinyl transferase superfamily protein [Casimicrobiaceae bacterium]